MNASEIRTRIADLEKASKDNLPAERFIEILNSLRNEIKITEKLLRVGSTINSRRYVEGTLTMLGSCGPRKQHR